MSIQFEIRARLADAAAAALECLGVRSDDRVLVLCNEPQASVVLAATTFSISHTRARIEASSRGARIAGI